jgi:hypothetical protein
MFTKNTSNGNSRRATLIGASLSVLLIGSGLGVASLWAATHGPHYPPCHRGELINHRTGACYVPVYNCIPTRSNNCPGS